ncbi:hypothetical protein [Streptomyces sp. SMS_SU21]|uniref:hypothetical protein n=1 Tax=Streptomyces sp. SMS_SU21 TaxID=2069440 RepID=UPI0015E82722|nr:hypothetical protein [Streptomyces sp. SMS_SU21]MCA2199793.1 hypothetical protein [Streptomyces sp. SMS_SU21]
MVIAELAATAVHHGCVAGRGFRLGLTVATPGTLRIEVTDPAVIDCPHPKERSAGGARPVTAAPSGVWA